MKKLLILSGKGGTGKTTTTAAFIRFANAQAFADCDVDAPNLHIVSSFAQEPTISDYYGSEKAHIHSESCIGCGACMQACRFGAIKQTNGSYAINEYACEGCGVCAYVCPSSAAALQPDVAGELTLYRDSKIFSSAKLKMGRGNSGKLVTAVKTALTDAAAPETPLAILDGSPGIGCPVIASINGVDLVLIVAEPSLSGLSDMKRILHTADMFQTKAVVCVNKYDLSLDKTNMIIDFCKENNIPFVGQIPFDKQASKAINNGMSLADINCPARDALYSVYQNTLQYL